jgi:hypothetical protein
MCNAHAATGMVGRGLLRWRSIRGFEYRYTLSQGVDFRRQPRKSFRTVIRSEDATLQLQACVQGGKPLRVAREPAYRAKAERIGPVGGLLFPGFGLPSL